MFFIVFAEAIGRVQGLSSAFAGALPLPPAAGVFFFLKSIFLVVVRVEGGRYAAGEHRRLGSLSDLHSSTSACCTVLSFFSTHLVEA